MALYNDKELLLIGRKEMKILPATEILSEAITYGNKCTQIFQPEDVMPEVILRVAMRISTKPLPVCPQRVRPDYTIVLDDSLLELLNVTEGLKRSGTLLVNSSYSPPELIDRFGIEFSTATVDLDTISIREVNEQSSENYYRIGILGAFARISGEVSLKNLNQAVSTFYSQSIAQQLIRTIRKAFRTVKIV